MSNDEKINKAFVACRETADTLANSLGATPEERLSTLRLTLPPTPSPIANFVPYQRCGSLIFMAGQTCEWHGTMPFRGKVGIEYTIEQGQEAARNCALNLLAALREALGGSLDRMVQCQRLGGFVNCAPDFDRVPAVIDGASDLMAKLFGGAGLHARTAVGVATLPQCATVEVDGIFEVR